MLDARVGQPRFGIVSSVDPSTATAKVLLQPEGVLTGWLPISTSWAGAGWGMVCPPAPGDQVLVVPQEGRIEHGIVIGRVFSRRDTPPDAPVGEFWLIHRSGSFVKLRNDGTIAMKGDLHVDGEIYDRHGSLKRLRDHYNVHRHRAFNGSDTDIPNATDF